MGLVTDLLFGLGNIFKWTFENILIPIGYYADWLLFIVGFALLVWWLGKLLYFGNDNEKEYEGW